MAPSAVETETVTVPDVSTLKLQAAYSGPYKELASARFDAETEAGLKGHKAAKVCPPLSHHHTPLSLTLWLTREMLTRQYPNYLPTWDRSEKYAPLEPFEHYEHGKDADTTFPNLLPKDQVTVKQLTPTIGTEVRGIQLSTLSDAGKDELARFVAERKVVAFRDQDFADLPIEKALEFGGYFGRWVLSLASSLSHCLGWTRFHVLDRQSSIYIDM